MKNLTLILILCVLSLSHLTGCSQDRQSDPKNDTSENKMTGGADGSGGNTGLSTLYQVSSAHKSASSKMEFALARMNKVLEHEKFSEDNSIWTQSRIDLLKEMMKGNSKLQKSALDLWKEGEISWKLKNDSACESTDGKHVDGAAQVPHSICISLYRLKRFPFEQLELRFIQLYSHELAHLYFGSDEAIPHELEEFFTENSQLIFPDVLLVHEVYEALAYLQEYVEGFEARTLGYDQTDRIYHLDPKEVNPKIKVLEILQKKVFFPPQFQDQLNPAISYVKKMLNRRVPEDQIADIFTLDIPDEEKVHFSVGQKFWMEFYGDILNPMNNNTNTIEN